MTSDRDYDIAGRYLAGECSDSERSAIENRMAEDPEFAATVEALRTLWRTETSGSERWDTDAFWSSMSRRIDLKEAEQGDAELRSVHQKERRAAQSGRVRRGTSWVARLAALFVVGGMIALFTVIYQEEPLDVKGDVVNEVATERGQRAEVQLEDGTRIRLNSESRITYPTGFNEGVRTVTLSGEAYFDIARDERPFIVHAEGAEIQILGTAFNVTAYRDEEELQIVVAEGAIDVRFTDISQTRRDIAQLIKGDRVEIERSTGAYSLSHEVDLAYHLGWLDYRLDFDDRPVAEVARILERWYGVEIRFAEPELAGLRLSANFSDDSVQEVIRVMELSLGLEADVDGREITFFNKD